MLESIEYGRDYHCLSYHLCFFTAKEKVLSQSHISMDLRQMTFSACPRFLEPEMKEQAKKLTAFIFMQQN